jgi:hypothetical protein
LREQIPEPRDRVAIMRRITIVLSYFITGVALITYIREYEHTGNVSQMMVKIASLCISYGVYFYSKTRVGMYAGWFGLMCNYWAATGALNELNTILSPK